MRAFSSAGSEHLPYKQRVGGSNPSTPTLNIGESLKVLLFLCLQYSFSIKRGQRIFPVGMMGKALTHIMRIE